MGRGAGQFNLLSQFSRIHVCTSYLLFAKGGWGVGCGVPLEMGVSIQNRIFYYDISHREGVNFLGKVD